jgi:DNA polymerase III subunit delta
VYGDDPYLVRESIHAVVRCVFADPEEADAAVTRFPGATTPLASVLDEVFTLPFFSRRRLVVVEDADPFVTKYRRELENYLENPCESGSLLLQLKQFPATTIIAKRVNKIGLAIDCSSPNEADLMKWLIHWAQSRFGVQLDPESARFLVDLVGPETGILASEVEKLAVYAGDAKRIDRADIAKLVDAGRVETIWKTLDSATLGQARNALEFVDSLLSSGEHPTPVLAAMGASLLKIHHAGQLRGQRLSLEEACRIAGIPPFAVDKTRQQHAHLGPRRVDRIPEILLKGDLDIKGGSTLDPRIVIELFLARLAAPRAD